MSFNVVRQTDVATKSKGNHALEKMTDFKVVDGCLSIHLSWEFI